MIRDREFDRQVGRVVKLLGKAIGVPMTMLANELQMSYTALNARLAGDTSFSAFEVAALAEYFDVDPGVFFDNPLTLIVGPVPVPSGRTHPAESRRRGVRATGSPKRHSHSGEFRPEILKYHRVDSKTRQFV